MTLPLETVKNAILGFSKEGKPLKEDGYVHLYFNDGSNQQNQSVTSVNLQLFKERSELKLTPFTINLC